MKTPNRKKGKSKLSEKFSVLEQRVDEYRKKKGFPKKPITMDPVTIDEILAIVKGVMDEQ